METTHVAYMKQLEADFEEADRLVPWKIPPWSIPVSDRADITTVLFLFRAGQLHLYASLSPAERDRLRRRMDAGHVAHMREMEIADLNKADRTGIWREAFRREYGRLPESVFELWHGPHARGGTNAGENGELQLERKRLLIVYQTSWKQEENRKRTYADIAYRSSAKWHHRSVIDKWLQGTNRPGEDELIRKELGRLPRRNS